MGLRRAAWLPVLTVALAAAACSDAPELAPELAPAPFAEPRARTAEVRGASEARRTGGDVLDLGDVTLGTDVAFALPAGTLGFHVLVEGEEAQTVGVERITSPSGAIVLEAFAPSRASSRTALSGHGPVAAAQVPQSDAPEAHGPEPGVWTLRFAGPDGVGRGTHARAHVRFQRTDDGAFHGGALDLRVHVPPGLVMENPGMRRTLDATSAAHDEAMAARVDAFFAALAEHFELDRGEVRFVPADGAFTTIRDEATLARAFASAGAITDAPVLDVLFTNALPGGAWGVAPAIPGAVGGAARGGSLVVLAHDGTDAPDDALTLLHEVGHFMGLSHTSESGGAHFDPLGDTAQCPTLDLTEPRTIAACPDGHNLMFPAFLGVTRGLGITLTEGQRRVVHGSPLYRAYASARARMASRPASLPLPPALSFEGALPATRVAAELRPCRTLSLAPRAAR